MYMYMYVPKSQTFRYTRNISVLWFLLKYFRNVFIAISLSDHVQPIDGATRFVCIQEGHDQRLAQLSG